MKLLSGKDAALQTKQIIRRKAYIIRPIKKETNRLTIVYKTLHETNQNSKYIPTTIQNRDDKLKVTRKITDHVYNYPSKTIKKPR